VAFSVISHCPVWCDFPQPTPPGTRLLPRGKVHLIIWGKDNENWRVEFPFKQRRWCASTQICSSPLGRSWVLLAITGHHSSLSTWAWISAESSLAKTAAFCPKKTLKAKTERVFLKDTCFSGCGRFLLSLDCHKLWPFRFGSFPHWERVCGWLMSSFWLRLRLIFINP